MKITANQLRRIIKEEISQDHHTEEAADNLFRSTLGNIRECEIALDRLLNWIDAADYSSALDPKLSEEEWTAAQKIAKIAENIVKQVQKLKLIPGSQVADLNESYKPITREEMNAWMRGDWGFETKINEEKFYDSTADWAENAVIDGRTVGDLLDAHDDMTKVASGVSGTDYQDLFPLADEKISALTGKDRARAEELIQDIIMLDSLPPM